MNDKPMLPLLRWLAAAAVLLAAGCSVLPGSGADEPATPQSYTNPVFVPSFADPSVIRAEDGLFYAYATEEDWGDGKGTRTVPVIRSEDLVHWTYVRDAFDLDGRPSWKQDGGGIWAPEIARVNDSYYLYYSLATWGDMVTPGIGVAVSDRPEGPFADKGKLFTSEEIGVGNSIDPNYFEDDDGRKYLIWGSFRGIYGIPLTSDGLRTEGEKFQLAGNAVEASYLIKRDGWYYLFASSGTCCEGANSSYAVMVGRSKSVRGPYLDREGHDLTNSPGTLVMMGNNLTATEGTLFAGPGHNDVVTDDGGADWLVYHAIEVEHPALPTGGVRRPLMIDRIVWQDGWPSIENIENSGTERPGPMIRKR